MSSIRFVHEDLERALQVLSQSAESQVALLPPVAEFADEFALDHETAWESFKASDEFQLLDPSQLRALEALDRKLEVMSGPENSELWALPSLAACDAWEEVRRLASEALELMGWRSGPPSSSTAIYVYNQ